MNKLNTIIYDGHVAKICKLKTDRLVDTFNRFYAIEKVYMVFFLCHNCIGSIILLLYMYLAKIGRKINSKTICRIKNLFVTTYIHTHVYVFLLLYIFSLSLCTRTEASRKSSFFYRESETRWEKRKTSGRKTAAARVNNNSLFLSGREQMCCFLCRLYFSEPLTIYVTNGEK